MPKIQRAPVCSRKIIFTAIVSVAGTSLYFHYLVMPSACKDSVRDKLKYGIDRIFD